MDSVDDTSAQLAAGDLLDPADESKAYSFLVIIIDLHSDGWLHQSEIPLWDALKALTVLANAHLALNSSNQLAVLGFNSLGARVLHSTTKHKTNSTDYSEDGQFLEGSMIRQFKKFDEKMLEGIKNQIEEAYTSNAQQTTSVAGPLSLALSHLNRHIKEQEFMRGHILVLSASGEDMGSKYIATMNTIFTAQKLRVPLDVANFGPPRSFLQQAAEFTRGSYLEFKQKDKDGLIHFFTSVFLIEPSVRKLVNLATKSSVDFSAVCFVTQKILEIGFVCSVCLCIMQEVPENKTCPVCTSVYN